MPVSGLDYAFILDDQITQNMLEASLRTDQMQWLTVLTENCRALMEHINTKTVVTGLPPSSPQ